MFDQKAYWIDRLERYRNDPRSVGNLGRSLEENQRSEALVMARVGAVARLLRPCASVLDVGCGYGRAAKAFCDVGYAYTGIDISEAAIERARELEPRGRYVVGSALEAHLGGQFDLVCVLYVFVHFVDDADWALLVDRLAKSVANGGAMLFADTFPDRTERPAPHVAHRPLRRYRERLRRHGMRFDPGFRRELKAALGIGREEPLPFHLARKRTA
jgi:SAM-dependent methyltransferase